MKKLIGILVAFVIVFGCAFTAFADMDPPFTLGYEAVVTNPNGAKFAISDGTYIVIPYGTVIEARGEYESNGKTYVYCIYGDENGNVSLSDIAKMNESVGSDKAVKLPSPEVRVCLSQNRP